MQVALAVEADRAGLHETTMAMVLLRRALDRAIESEEVKRQVKLHVAARTAEQWRQETADERLVEVVARRVSGGGDAP
jgi:hypothetical protein